MGTVTIKWIESTLMTGADSNGRPLTIGWSRQRQPEWTGLKPSDLLLLAAASCSTYDVVDILAKQREPLEDLEVICRGEQLTEPPYNFTCIHLHYKAKGAVNSNKLARAIQLSEEKYCSVTNTLKPTVRITSSCEIIELNDRVKTKLSLRQRLLRIPLFYKILLANSAIVGLGAVAGTVITVWHVRRYPADIHYELIVFFAIAGIVISFFVNRWTLKRALEPLERLQEAVNQVRQGQTDVQVTLGSVSDEQFDRLTETFNRMLLKHERHTEQMQQLSRQILQAQEEERQRLARELHDEAAQALTSLLVHLRLLERAREPEKAQQNIQKLRELTAQALEEVRRVALDLRPTILDDLGLGAALEWRVDEFTQASGVQAKIQIEGLEKRLPRDIELVFYRVGQETLNNIARHAQAKHVSVSLRRENGTISLEVVDDGVGFNPAVRPTFAPRGLGLLGMRERMAMIDGILTLESAPGNGTRVLASAPLKEDDTDGAKSI